MTLRAREQVRTDFKPEPAPKRAPKRLKRGNGFRRNPTLAAQFRFAVLHEFGGRCILADYTGGTDESHTTLVLHAADSGGSHQSESPKSASAVSGTASDRILTDAETTPGARPQLLGRLSHICDGPLDPAHLIPKQTLRKLGFPETVVYDQRVGVAACRRAHRRNDDGLERFPRELLPPSVFDFARDHDLTYLLDKLYPQAAERSTRETA